MLTNSQGWGSAIHPATAIADGLTLTQQFRRATSALALKQMTEESLPTQDFQHFRRPELAQFYAVILSRGGRIGC